MPRVYMYGFHERMWHWMQAVVILALLFTGIEVHFPEGLELLGFAYAVRIHTILGFVLIANAGLGLLYHVFSGEIGQFLPEPTDFFSASIKQARYYLSGIFKGEPHPFEKSRRKKLNPLQKITYLAILNILLPLQVVTGFSIWAAQHWPGAVRIAGDLAFLAPVHTLLAWLFGAFLIMHIYLATTGRKPLSNFQAMIIGWEYVDEDQHKDGNHETGQ